MERSRRRRWTEKRRHFCRRRRPRPRLGTTSPGPLLQEKGHRLGQRPWSEMAGHGPSCLFMGINVGLCVKFDQIWK